MSRCISNYKSVDMIFNHTVKDSPSDNNFHFHTHDICEMIFIKSGNTAAIIDSKEYKLYENSLVIFRSSITHRIKILDGLKPYERYAILFDEKIIADMPFKKLDKNLNVVNCTDSLIADIFPKMDYYSSKLPEDDFKIILKNLIEEIVYNLSLMKADEIESNYNVINPVVNSAVEYISKNFKSQITINDICRELYVSKCHLHHLFSDFLTVSPKRYINIKRLTEARKLIRLGHKPHNIYSECGFTDYGTFYRNYKNYFGHIPSKENESEIERTFKS